MSGEAVAVSGLVKRYGDLTAVNGVSFEVHKGEIFALLGPNGAGKTTTVEILECIRKPTSGRIEVLGEDITTAAGAGRVKMRAGVLPQEMSAFNRLTVRENLGFFAGLYGGPADIDGLLDTLGIRDKAGVRFKDLSGGLKQRVGVAAALVNDPELLFLDEPTTGLDPEARHVTWKIIRDLRSRGKTVILTTHYMEEAEALADRIAIMVKGGVAGLGSPSELIAKYGGGKTMVFKQAGDSAFGTLRRFFDEVSMEGADVVLPFDDSRVMQVALTALVERGLRVELTIRTANLEEVFLKLAGFRIAETGEAR
jgi:ABC-2 type transport system ATP-binding protein